jgi:hypothetical protein
MPDLGGEPVLNTADLAAPSRSLRQRDLSAKMVGGLKQNDLMTT